MKRPKVLHVIHSGALGGGPEMVRALALADDGVEHIVVSTGDGGLFDSLRQGNVRVEPIRMNRKRDLPNACVALRRFVRSQSPDAVVSCGQFSGAVVAAALLGLPQKNVYVVAWPSYLADKGPIRTARNWLVERLSTGAADTVVFLNSNEAKQFLRRRLVLMSKICVIRNGVDHEHFRRVAPPQLKVVGFVGRLVKEKGVDVLLEAVALLPDAVANGLVVEVVGDGILESDLKAQAARLFGRRESRAEIRFVSGYRVGPEWFSKCSVVVIPSREEPFGIVALEAMACEAAVIATNVGGLKESIEDGISGLLVETDSPSELAEALTRLLSDAPERESMGRHGRSRIEQHYTEKRYVDNYRDLY